MPSRPGSDPCLLLSALLILLMGCAQQSPSVRLQDAASALNLATRFGRLDVAAEYTDDDAQEDFLTRRARWGEQVRVVDINVTRFKLQDTEAGEVDVDIDWVPWDESTLRSTSIRQTWEHSPGKGWRLTHERKVAGDRGLFGDAPPASKPRPKPAHFPVTTIRGSAASYD